MQIAGSHVWITGASSGIGETLAKMLAEAGAILTLSARSEDKLQTLKKTLVNSEKHKVVALDLSQTDNLAAIVEKHQQQGHVTDILINNGGISQRGTARNTLLQVQRKVMEVNYFGTITLTQALLPELCANEGMVVNVSSVAGKVGGQSMAGYAASKHALIGYMDSLRAEETQHGLKVLNICPGFVQTNISVNAMTEGGDKFGEVAKSIATGITTEQCGAKIINAIEKDKCEVVIGKGLSGWAPTIKRLFPNLLYKVTAKTNIR